MFKNPALAQEFTVNAYRWLSDASILHALHASRRFVLPALGALLLLLVGLRLVGG